jgi:cyclopropane fatty-acyl-phospholipid synthase-like methyltransferase
MHTDSSLAMARLPRPAATSGPGAVLSRGQDLTELGCGRGGPGLWLARELDVGLTGVDFSPVAVEAGSC